MGGISRAYLDTYNFLNLFTEESSRDLTRSLFYKLKQNSYHVIVPQIILGEIVSQILEKPDKEERLSDFRKFHNLFFDYNINVNECLPGMSENACEIMSKIRNIDEYIDPNDAIILAHVLADPDSKFFITPDSKILGNQKLIKYANSLYMDGKRNTKLKIQESI